MALRLFTEDTGWEQARRDLRHTAAALAAHDSHSKLAKPLRAHLEQWDAADKQRRDADDAVVDTNAVIAFLDVRLDVAVEALAERVRYEEHGTDGPAFRAYFPEAPGAVIRLGLESELDRVKAFHDVARERGASKEVQRALAEIAAVDTAGRKALAARADAVANVARVALRMHTWKEGANKARRSVEAVLTSYAAEHNLPRDYADAFFPARKRTGKPAGKGGGSGAPGGEGGAAGGEKK